jgi:HSP20 family protein
MEDNMTFNFQIQAQQPPVEIKESDNAYKIAMEIPGSVRDDIKIWSESGNLVITGEKKISQANRIWAERSGGKFTRTFQLPSDAAIDKVEAIYRDGILSVAIPKAEQAKPKAIEIK